MQLITRATACILYRYKPVYRFIELMFYYSIREEIADTHREYSTVVGLHIIAAYWHYIVEYY